jgi:hypothetical protein
MLSSKQCDLLINLLDQQPFKGREVAREIIKIGEELDALKKTALEVEKTGPVR